MYALFSILGVFAMVLFLLRYKINLGLSLLLASGILFLLHGVPPLQAVSLTISTFLDPENLELIAAVMAIMCLATFLSRTGGIERMVQAGKNLVRGRRRLSVVLPFMIGLLPMPGGALFSAPMVDASRPSHRTTTSTLTFINYWFRHVWEYVLPLYPAILLFSNLAEVPLSWVMSRHLPFALIAAVAGWWVVRREPEEEFGENGGKEENAGNTGIFRAISPVVVPVIVILLGGPAWLGAVLGIVASVLFQRVPVKKIFSSLWGKASAGLVLDITGILVFQAVLLGTGVVNQTVEYLVARDLPVLALGMGIPFLVALVSGFSAAFVGISLPVVLPLLTGYPLEAILPLVFMGGYAGIIFSPTHLCLVVSCRYFDVQLASVYRKMILPTLAVASWAVFWFFLNR